MPTFGFSAFLKLVCLNDRPQRTEVRHRIVGRGDGGYDYHSSMERLARAILEGQIAFDDAIDRTNEIVKASERASAIRGLSALNTWLAANASPSLRFQPAVYNSPMGHFSMKFTSDFGQLIRDRPTAIHIWNTATPQLSANLVRMALSLATEAYRGTEPAPLDLGVLDLPNATLILLSEAPNRADLGTPLASRIDRLFETVENEIREQDRRRPDRPGAPPPV